MDVTPLKSLTQPPIKRSSGIPLALHACCGPCTLEPFRLLQAEGFVPSIFWANVNIQPENEYQRRLETLLAWADGEGVEVIDCDCLQKKRETWEEQVAPLAKKTLLKEDLGLRQNRCRACYRLRLTTAAEEAKRRGFAYLSTTLVVSPYQHFDVCQEELKRAADAQGMKAVWRDFRDHYREATRRSRELGMYRQKYCGCRFSASEAALQR